MNTEQRNGNIKQVSKELKGEEHSLPARKFRAGAVCATIWNNKVASKEGAEFSMVSLERSYTDKEGKWQTTSSLRVSDLPRASIVLAKAYEFLVLSEQEPVREHA